MSETISCAGRPGRRGAPDLVTPAWTARAPSDGVTIRGTGSANPRSWNVVVTERTTCPTLLAGTSAITDPPNPPPVIRAPIAPAARLAVDSDVEFRAGHLVVVLQGPMRCGEQFADVGDVALAEQRDSAGHPVVLGDHMTDSAAQHIVVELVQRGRQFVDRQVAQGGDTEDVDGLFARGATLRIFPVGQ